jgi:hypothetical protein
MRDVVGIEQTDLCVTSKFKSLDIMRMTFSTIPRIDPTTWNIFPEIPLPPVMVIVASLEESFKYRFRILNSIFVNVLA